MDDAIERMDSPPLETTGEDGRRDRRVLRWYSLDWATLKGVVMLRRPTTHRRAEQEERKAA